jgi:hypothetical protein
VDRPGQSFGKVLISGLGGFLGPNTRSLHTSSRGKERNGGSCGVESSSPLPRHRLKHLDGVAGDLDGLGGQLAGSVVAQTGRR